MVFNKTIGTYKEIINKEIDLLFKEHIERLDHEFLSVCYKYLHSYLLAGGKRLRPIALIMSYKGFGGDKDILRTSLAVELFHNSTLIHDDMMDDDVERRNNPTYHMQILSKFLNDFGEKKISGQLYTEESVRFAITQGILAGNIFYAMGEGCLTSSLEDADSIRKALDIYSKAFIAVNHGQVLDNLYEHSPAKEDQYLAMSFLKTANLFRASVQIGAALASAPEEQVCLIGEAAEHAAIAFQLQDDIMDITKEANKGHEFGSDIKKGKRTLMVIRALQSASEKQKDKILSILGKHDASEAEIILVKDILNSTGSINYTQELAKQHIQRCKELLKKTTLSDESRSFFEGFADFMLDRMV